jgi:predicted flap endonuclease-1-like 5' DNA nuclease
MVDVVRDILLCLLIAALLGAAVGWLLRGLRGQAAAEKEAAGRRQQLEHLRHEHERTLAASNAAREEVDATHRLLKEAELARDAARHDISGSSHQLTTLSARLMDAEATRDVARAELATNRLRVAEAEGQRDAARREVERLRAEFSSKAPASDATRQQVETLRATLHAAESGWDTARAQTEAAIQQLGATRHQLRELDTERTDLSAQLAATRTLLEQQREELDAFRAQLAEFDVQKRLLPEAAKEAQPSARREGARREAGDDLQRIRGIGPALERMLHRAGVYRYEQIAAWTREEIAAMAERLPGFHHRIVRDRWIASAHRLHLAKYGSPPSRTRS